MCTGEKILGYTHPRTSGINTIIMIGMCMEMMYWMAFFRLAYIFRPMAIASIILAKSSSTRMRLAASLAISVPFLPMAIPMCADFKAGPSLTPSPVMATIWLFAFKASIILSLASGNIRVKMVVCSTFSFRVSLSMAINSSPFSVFSGFRRPICLAIVEVVVALSPVTIFTIIPAL